MNVRHPDQGDGRWKVHAKNVAVYARAELTLREQIAAAKALASGEAAL